MGRKKLEIKLIQDPNSRLVTFSKRRSGLFKKASQLSILCDVQIAALIFSKRGKLYEFSRNNSLEAIIQQYRDNSTTEGRLCTGVYEHKVTKNASSGNSGVLLQTVERCLAEPNIDQLSVADFTQLEKEVHAALFHTRCRKTQQQMDYITTLQDQEKLLTEENQHLQEQILAATQEDPNLREAGTGLNNLDTNEMNQGTCEDLRRKDHLEIRNTC